MKKKIGMIVLFVLMSSVIFAQHRTHHNMGENSAREMKEKLSLSEEQFNKVKNLNATYGDQLKAVRRDSTLSREKVHGQLKALNQAKHQELKTILTEQQYTQWSAIKKEKHDRKRNMGHRVNGEEMKKALSLNDDQYAKVKAVNNKYGEQLKTLRKDSTLSQVTARAEVKKIKDERQGELKTIMTEEQYAKWQTLKADQKKHKFEKRKK